MEIQCGECKKDFPPSKLFRLQNRVYPKETPVYEMMCLKCSVKIQRENPIWMIIKPLKFYNTNWLSSDSPQDRHLLTVGLLNN